MKTLAIEPRKKKENSFVEKDSETCQVPIDQYFIEIERACAKLNELERKAIFLRFWCDTKIARIADSLGLSWDEANLLIDLAVRKINRALKTKIRPQTELIAA